MSAELAVDIEGAVAKPGLYQVPLGSRVEDVIVLAGGLAADADSDRIARELNRAARISDGAKLYIPKKGDTGTRTQSGIESGGQVSGAQVSAQVSINGASMAQLEELVGVGPATAKKIIDNRPYQTLGELVTKKAMGQSLFDKLKSQLTL